MSALETSLVFFIFCADTHESFDMKIMEYGQGFPEKNQVCVLKAPTRCLAGNELTLTELVMRLDL